MAAVKLLVERLPTTWASELAVECLLRLGLWGQYILMSLDELPGELWIKFLKNRHVREVA
jgi:hypothetical protein